MLKQMVKPTLTCLAIIMALVLATGCSGSGTPGNDTVKIGIIQIIDHPALDSAREGFVDGLAEAGYTEGDKVVYDFQNAQGDMSNAKTMSQKLVDEKSDLILAIATPTAQSVAAETKTIPILITAVTDPVDAALVDDYKKPNTNVTGTSDMTPVAKQFELLVQLLPEAESVAIMYNSSESNSLLQANIAIETCERLGLDYLVATVTGTNDVAQVTESVVNKVDVIYVPTDNTLAASVPVMTKITDAAGIPIIIGEEGGVELGALATEGLNYYNLGKQTAAMAVKILSGESSPQDMPIEYLEETTMVINKTTANKLGITIPEDLLNKAVIVE